ncbi:hypothetical protein D3C75_584420 [compost metagenome]
MAERCVQRGQLWLAQSRRLGFPNGQVEIEQMLLPAAIDVCVLPCFNGHYGFQSEDEDWSCPTNGYMLPAKRWRGVVLLGASALPYPRQPIIQVSPARPQTDAHEIRRLPPWSMSEISNRDRPQIRRDWGQDWGHNSYFLI